MTCCSTSASDWVWTGTTAPAYFTVTISPEAGDPFVPTDVTAAVLKMAAPGGSGTSSWACTIESADATSLVIKHVFQSGDVDIAGTYEGLAELTLPGGVVRSKGIKLVAKAKPGD